jgi:hypothetical protein
MSKTRKKILNSQCKDIVYNVSKYFEEQASDPSTTPVNAYIQKTVDATSISERSIRRIGKEQSDNEVLLSPPKTRNREPRKPVMILIDVLLEIKFMNCILYVVSYQLLRNCRRV